MTWTPFIRPIAGRLAPSRRVVLCGLAAGALLLLAGCDNDFGVTGGTQARLGPDEIRGRLFDLAAKGDVNGLHATIRDAQAQKIDIDARNSQGLRALDIAALNDRGLAARALVVGGSDIHGVDAKGNSVMHYAARAGSLSTIHQLMSFVPDLKARNKAGQTPADVARARQRPDIAALLERPNS
jgi:ankyrin repeat protein